MAKFIDITTKYYFGRLGLHLFDQWGPRFYKQWVISFIEVTFFVYSNKCLTIRVKILGLCLEIFVIFKKPDADIPF